MLGLQWCFFEAVGESTQAKWHYQPGSGSYRKINSYQHVGVGKGDFVKEDSTLGVTLGGEKEWLLVGKGSGSYIRVQTFQHVGQGQGDYDKEEITSYSEWKLRPCCLRLCFVLLVLLVAFLAVLSWPNNLSQNWKARVQRAERAVGLGAAPDESYNCDVDFTDWKLAWSNTKKDWCCQNFQRGCHRGYDCNAGFISWKTTWSLNKKEWCCSHRGRGCESKGTQLYDCDSGYEDWKTKWTQGQKVWCCTVYDRGCPSSPASPSEFQVRYDCKSASPSTWTLQKQTWCCKNSGMGCREAQHSSAHNCQADLHNVASWRDEKRNYCCKHHTIGCAFNCDAGYDRWKQGWSTQKKRFCCNHHGKACELDEPEPKADPGIDCNGDADIWPAVTRLYCCKHHNKGCPTTTTTTLSACAAAVCQLNGQKYSCEARINYAARTVFAHQRNACGKAHQDVLSECDVCSSCSLGQVVCQALPVTKPFDCHAALQNWVTRWSAEKKAWCCKHEMKGCVDSYCDNLEELHRWTKSKKAFCCRIEGNGCTGSQAPHLPAGPGYTWRHAKVDSVYTWVRHPVQPKPSHQQAVHSTSGFDCDDGFWDFVHGWSTAKKHWCCTHKGLACTGPNHPAVPLKLQHQWERREINGVWTWTQVQSHVTKTYDCTEGMLEAPPDKLTYCCEHFGKACN